MKKPRIGVFKFASCDGCQLQLLEPASDLLTLAGTVEIAYFPEMRSRRLAGPYDIAFVEGSITTADDARRIVQLREQSRFLITIGACATAGGIQALRNWADFDEYGRSIYPSPEFIETLSTSTPISEHVRVDFELWGCPIDPQQLLGVMRALLSGARPALPSHSVCMECKRRGNVCVVVAKGEPCLGPVTRTGCGALCPHMQRGCYGCFGPADRTNMPAFAALLRAHGLSRDEAVRRLRGINGYVRPWREMGDALEKKDDWD